jgi:hypothetical protein
MGDVIYGHVTSPAVGNNSVYNLTSGIKLIGTATSGGCTGCSTGTHSHMETKYGTVVAPCCGASVTTSTAIYQFSWSNNIPC